MGATKMSQPAILQPIEEVLDRNALAELRARDFDFRDHARVSGGAVCPVKRSEVIMHLIEIDHRPNLEVLANAIKRSKIKRVKTHWLGNDECSVKCANPEHPTPHIVRFQERGIRLYAACDCPSRVACYHLVHAALQREVARVAAMMAQPVLMPRVPVGEKVRGIRI